MKTCNNKTQYTQYAADGNGFPGSIVGDVKCSLVIAKTGNLSVHLIELTMRWSMVHPASPRCGSRLFSMMEGSLLLFTTWCEFIIIAQKAGYKNYYCIVKNYVTDL